MLKETALFKENIFGENDFFEEDAYLIKLVNELPENSNVEKNDLQKLKEHFSKDIEEEPKHPDSKKFKENKEFENKVEEVDLHIQELIDDPSGLSNGEMVEMQMAHFRTKLDEAIQNRKKRIAKANL